MSNRVTPYEAFHANLSAAGTTLMLCRANLLYLKVSQEEAMETLRRIEGQIYELEGMYLELIAILDERSTSSQERPCFKSID